MENDEELLQAVREGDLEFVQENIDSDTWYRTSPEAYWLLLRTSIERNRRKLTKFFLELNRSVNLKVEQRPDSTPLHRAIAKKNVLLVHELLKRKANINAKDENNDTAVHLAVKSKRVAIVNIIVSYIRTERIMNFINNEGLTHLHVACASNNSRVVRAFLRKGASVKCTVSLDAPYWRGYTPLHFAVYYNRNLITMELLRKGASPDVADAKGITPLHLAFRNKNHDLVKLMIRRKHLFQNLKDDMDISYFHIVCSLNDRDILERYLLLGCKIDECISPASFYLPGYTPLHVAVMFGCRNTISWLLKQRADFTKVGSDGLTPLHLAFWRNEYEIIDLFMEAFVENDTYENVVDPQGVNFLHICCLRDHPNIVKEFIDRGVGIDTAIKYTSEKLAGCTPLHIAVRFANPNTVRLLLTKGANIHAVNRKGETPLHHACQGNKEKMLEIGKFVSQIDLSDEFKNVDLLQAYLNRTVEVVTLLVKHGANVNIKDRFNLSPIFHLFKHRYDVSLVKLLSTMIPINHISLRQQVLDMVSESRNEMIKAMAQSKLNMSFTDNKGYTLLHYMAGKIIPHFMKGQEEIAQLMIENGANVNALNKQGKTPLFLAVQQANESLVEVLLFYRANANIYNHRHKLATALGAAVDYMIRSVDHNTSIIKLLVTYGAEVNARLPNGRTVIHEIFACGKFYDSSVFQALCVGDIDLDIQDLKEGKTPLHFATLAGVPQGVEWLLYGGARYDVLDYQGMTPVQYCVQQPHKTGFVYYNHFKRLRFIGYKFKDSLEADITLMKNASNPKNILPDSEYLEELKGLKRVRISKYSKLYNLLLQSPQEISKYVNNLTVHRLLSEAKFCYTFPLYGTMIAIKYANSRMRHMFSQPSLDSIRYISGKPIPDEVGDVILGFLSNNDVKNLIVATTIRDTTIVKAKTDDKQ